MTVQISRDVGISFERTQTRCPRNTQNTRNEVGFQCIPCVPWAMVGTEFSVSAAASRPSMRLGEARDRVPFEHFLQQRALGFCNHTFQGAPGLYKGGLFARRSETDLH